MGSEGAAVRVTYLQGHPLPSIWAWTRQCLPWALSLAVVCHPRPVVPRSLALWMIYELE